ncbi:hypothetical protein [Cylindrospermum sp. FACHB-282]|nr:hypothetical protein [Cylindrospermum sp. FACHB-282]
MIDTETLLVLVVFQDREGTAATKHVPVIGPREAAHRRLADESELDAR